MQFLGRRVGRGPQMRPSCEVPVPRMSPGSHPAAPPAALGVFWAARRPQVSVPVEGGWKLEKRQGTITNCALLQQPCSSRRPVPPHQKTGIRVEGLPCWREGCYWR